MGIRSFPRSIPGHEVVGASVGEKNVRGREGEVFGFCQQNFMKRKSL